MDELNRIARNFYKVIEGFKDALTLPTDSSLYLTFKYSALLTGVSAMSSLLGFYVFLTWFGCFLCTAVLFLLLFMERSENHALSEMYRNAQVRAEQVKRRAKEASARAGLQRSPGSTNPSTKNAKGRPKRTGNVSNKRRAASNNTGNKHTRPAVSNRRNEKLNRRGRR